MTDCLRMEIAVIEDKIASLQLDITLEISPEQAPLCLRKLRRQSFPLPGIATNSQLKRVPPRRRNPLRCAVRPAGRGGVWRLKAIIDAYRMPVEFLRVQIKIFGQIKISPQERR